MKTILLLGGFGFLGTNLIKYVDMHDELSCRYKFIVFDRIPEHPHKIRFSSTINVYAGDFSDEIFIEKIFAENTIDIVIHSLSSTVPSTSQNACFDVETNLVSTLKLLSVMDRHGVKDIVYISSGGAIYGDVLEKVHNEEDAVYPKSSYGVVKLAIEKYLLSYAELYGFCPLILRVSNPFGKYHYNNKQGVINIAIRKSLKNEELEIWGSGDGVKDYIYVEDFCSILFRLIDTGVETGVYNVGGGFPLSVNDIFKYIKTINPSFTCNHINESLLDVQSFELDITKLRKKLGKLSYRSFPDALEETYRWQEEQ
jgi:UDP-glucose 4-epimerase